MENTDAVIAAPHSHKVLFENEKVRVVEVVVQPGQKEPMHTHAWPSVMMVDSSTRIKYYDEQNIGTEYPEREGAQLKKILLLSGWAQRVYMQLKISIRKKRIMRFVLK